MQNSIIKSKNTLRSFLIGCLAFGLFGTTHTAIANENSTVGNYKSRYTPQGRIKACERTNNCLCNNCVVGVGIVLVSTKTNYKSRYTPQGRIKAGKRGTYRKDVNDWVYTSAFAKRFGMPQEWINDDLKGAEKCRV
jgi:hypothetical protein